MYRYRVDDDLLLIPEADLSGREHVPINFFFLWGSSWMRTAKGTWLLSHQFPAGLAGAVAWIVLQAGASLGRCL